MTTSPPPSDLEVALATPTLIPLPQALATSLLANPPFLTIPGLFNVRDLSNGTTVAGIRPRYIFRSGNLSRLTEAGKEALAQQLGITHIFDLRSVKERIAHPAPEIPGIEVIWSATPYDNETTASGQESDKSFSVQDMYAEILISHRGPHKHVFSHILNHPDQPFLFHCTAGKDRTGVLAALILAIAGADLDYINREYALTRIGIEPARELLMAMLKAKDPNVDLKSKRMSEYVQIPLDLWTDVFRKMDKLYGGVSGYVKSELGFSEEEIQSIRRNLRADSAQSVL